MTRPHNRPSAPATALAGLLGLWSLAAGLPAAAQTDTQPPEDVPIIDLGPVLGAVSDTAGARQTTALPGADGPGGAVMTVPEEELTLPQYDRAVGLSPSRPPAAVSGVADGTGAPDATLLLPLRADRPTRDGITRLSGEVQSAGFFIDLPTGSDARDLTIAYRIAINVLPEQSDLRITVNGTALEPVRPRPEAFEGFQPIALPADLLVEGRNRIEVEVRHAHRIFCGPDATFAVWTEIDTNRSGARLDARELGLDAAGLALAVRAQLALSGSLPVRLTDPADAEVLAGFSNRLAALRDGAPVLMAPEPAYGADPAQPQRARITVLHGGPPLADVRRGADGALVLVLAGDAAEGLPDLDGLLPLPAPVQGNPVLPPGVVTALRNLHAEPLETFNRYAELPVRFQMPEDWLTLASQKALLRLGYGFAEGLPEGALMLVKVNETTVRLLPLDRGATDERDLLDVGFPARLLHPGVNVLNFVAIVPGDPPDLPCPPITAPLLTIDRDSTLEVPPSPRMVIPGMAATLRALRPDQIVPPSSEQAFTLSQRDTFAVLGSSLRSILGTERQEAASLTVARLGDTGAIPLDRLGLTRRDLDRLLTPPAADTATPDEPIGGSDPSPGFWFGDAARRLRQIALPGDGDLAEWLRPQHAEAVLFSPDPVQAPGDLWLVLGPEADPMVVAPALAEARLAPDGPRGQVSILTRDTHWRSWADTSIRPQLREPLTTGNFREVAGNFASWAPLYFGIALFGFTALSVVLALIFVVTTRGRRKR